MLLQPSSNRLLTSSDVDTKSGAHPLDEKPSDENSLDAYLSKDVSQ